MERSAAIGTGTTRKTASAGGTGSPRHDGWDVIVVGAGVGGLTSAAYLAANGRRVLVCEAQSVLGGAAQTFRRRRVFAFNTGAHYVGDCSPGAVIPTALRGVGLEGEVGLSPMDPDEFDRIVAPGFEFRVPRGWDAFEARLVEHFPDEEDGVRNVVRTLRRMGEAMERIGAPPIPGLRDLVRHARVLPDLRDGAMSLQQLFDRNDLSDGARAAIGYISNFVLLPREDLAAAIYAYGLHHYVKTGGWAIDGGVGTLPRTLARAVRCNGGEVRLRTPVDEVLVTDGQVRGVRLGDGTEIRASVVISNADIATTYGGLVPARHLRRHRVRRFADAGLSGCGFSVFLGVDVDIREHQAAQNLFDIGGLDYRRMLDTMFRSAPDAFDPDRALMWVTSGSLKDGPSEGAAGYSSLELTTLTPQNYAFWGLDGGPLDDVDYHRHPAYVAQKQRIEDALVRRALRLMPWLEGHIVWQESSTMLTHEDWTGSRFGAWAGLDFSIKNMALRPGPRTEVRGLFLAGASSSCGGAILGTLRGGVETAGAVLGRPLWKEVEAGAVFGTGLTDKGFVCPTESAVGAREHRLRVADVQGLTPDSVLVALEVPPDLTETFAHEPGQHVTIVGEAAGETVRRSYSICGSGPGRLQIAIKRVPGGVVSSHALEALRVGDELQVAPPRGTFVASPASRTRSLVGIAAGSGITPVIAIAAATLESDPDGTFTLLYGNRTVADTMFAERLEDLRRRFTDRFTVVHHLSRETAPAETRYRGGRLDAEALTHHLERTVVADDVDEWLICGPTGLIDVARTTLHRHGVEPARVKVEAFGGRDSMPELRDPIPTDATSTVELVAHRTSTAFPMTSARESILDAALRERSDLPYSCRNGTCGECRAKVVEGRVTMLDEPELALDAQEEDDGFVLTCISHPLTDRVVVDFDTDVGGRASA